MSKPVWFISGASSGFGLEMAKVALAKGHTVIAAARSTSRLTELAELGAETLAFDVTSSLSEIRVLAKELFDKYKRVDYLINAAGYILDGAVEEVSPEEVYACFNTNVFGVMNTLKAFLPYIRQQDVVKGKRATVVTFGSVGSWNGGATYSVYAMTKASASSLAESLRDELKPFDIVATVIEPGYFRTAFLNQGRRTTSKEKIDAYEDPSTPSGQMRSALEVVNNNQPGDPVRGAKVAVDVLTGDKQVPVRIVLGSDCDRDIREKCRSTVSILDEWKEQILSTDFPK